MNTRTLFSSALAAFLLAAGAHTANAQSLALTNDVPKTISYQGLLADTYGTSLPDGQYTITVALYTDPNGMHKVWQDTYNTQVSGGLFNLYLGAGNTPLPALPSLNTSLWIGTQVGDEPMMLPLTPLSASPYALNVPDRAITTGKLADASVTAEKVNMPYIAGVQINDQQIAGTGTVLKLRGSDAITLDYDAATNSVIFGTNNNASKATAIDDEKGSSVLDNTDGSENWQGRTTLSNPLIFQTPLGSYNTLAGGFSNTIGASNSHSTIPGGKENSIGTSGFAAVIGGGEDNSISTNVQNPLPIKWPTIAGGHLNTSTASHTFIGGGHDNLVSNESGTIGGGWQNEVSGEYGFIGAGYFNEVYGNYSTVAGGRNNATYDEYSFVGGGDGNAAAKPYSSVGGGRLNLAQGNYGIVGGGEGNEVWAQYGTIVGGKSNQLYGSHGFIGGGEGNATAYNGNYGVIGGGLQNLIAGNTSTIPGGDNLQTTAYAQTAMGFYNAPRGTLSAQPTTTAKATNNDPLLIVGNGTPATVGGTVTRSNAFEVSYNGHSVVYDVNGPTTAGGRAPIKGATYVDNILYAWGDISSGGAAVNEFGIGNATRTGMGVYRITLKIVDPVTNAPVNLAGSSVTATLKDLGEETPCGIITASDVGFAGPNTFTVRIRDMSCQPLDAHFMFKVTGRP